MIKHSLLFCAFITDRGHKHVQKLVPKVRQNPLGKSSPFLSKHMFLVCLVSSIICSRVFVQKNVASNSLRRRFVFFVFCFFSWLDVVCILGSRTSASVDVPPPTGPANEPSATWASIAWNTGKKMPT